LNWRWLPFVLTMNQPSSSIILMTALTFIHGIIARVSSAGKQRRATFDTFALSVGNPTGRLPRYQRRIVLKRRGLT
jgi:hypothetical protein